MINRNQMILTAVAFIIFLPVLVLASVKTKDVDKSAVMKKVSGLQIPFIENQGQIKDESVRYYANTFAGTVFITEKGEIVYSLRKRKDRSQTTDHRQKDSELHTEKAVALKESLECPEESKITGMNKAETKVNYFKGSKEDWKTDIFTWQEVNIGEVYKGIELKLRAYGKNVEKIFTVNLEGSVNDIKLKVEGAKDIRLNENGELEVETELGVIKYTKPVAYQEIDGKRVEIDINYVIPNSKLLTQDSNLMYAFKV